MNKVRQELWCHECQRYVQFEIDIELNGKHVIICPNCGHEHCRIVNNGVITEERWESRNGQQIPTNANLYFTNPASIQVYSNNVQVYVSTGLTTSVQSTYATYIGGGTGTVTDAVDAFSYAAWYGYGSGNGLC